MHAIGMQLIQLIQHVEAVHIQYAINLPTLSRACKHAYASNSLF